MRGERGTEWKVIGTRERNVREREREGVKGMAREREGGSEWRRSK